VVGKASTMKRKEEKGIQNFGRETTKEENACRI
jgi:hypothetical protein